MLHNGDFACDVDETRLRERIRVAIDDRLKQMEVLLGDTFSIDLIVKYDRPPASTREVVCHHANGFPPKAIEDRLFAQEREELRLPTCSVIFLFFERRPARHTAVLIHIGVEHALKDVFTPDPTDGTTEVSRLMRDYVDKVRVSMASEAHLFGVCRGAVSGIDNVCPI